MSGTPSSAYLSPVTPCRPAVAVRAEPDRSLRVSSEPAPLSLRLPRSAPWSATEHRRDWAQRKTATAPARFDGQVRHGLRHELTFPCEPNHMLMVPSLVHESASSLHRMLSSQSTVFSRLPLFRGGTHLLLRSFECVNRISRREARSDLEHSLSSAPWGTNVATEKGCGMFRR